MTKQPETLNQPFRVSGLSNRKPTHFNLVPNAKERAALAAELGITAVSALSFKGAITPRGRHDFVLEADLVAVVEQPCSVTLDPVITKIAEKVERRYIAGMEFPGGEEVEIPEDVTQEPLGEVIDPGEVVLEAMALALPLYPRSKGADFAEVQAAPEGVTPLRDADLRPFAGLAALRDSLARTTPEDDKE
jgi:uncharacterized metal-binding protein YceD (DUF177 family)